MEVSCLDGEWQRREPNVPLFASVQSQWSDCTGGPIIPLKQALASILHATGAKRHCISHLLTLASTAEIVSEPGNGPSL